MHIRNNLKAELGGGLFVAPVEVALWVKWTECYDKKETCLDNVIGLPCILL